MQVSAYIPTYRSAATLARAIAGVRAQTVPPEEFFMVDNGSSDDSVRIGEQAGVRVIQLTGAPGRGASRARAMAEARHPLVLCCDASMLLPPDFIARALPWFEEANVAAVTGRIDQAEAITAADRWRSRHLFRTASRTEVRHGAAFTTGAAMVRAAAVREAGGYDPACYHGEDADLGRRLLEKGFDVVFDPALTYFQVGSNTVGEVLERYCRWNTPAPMSFSGYLRQILYSIHTMGPEDLRAGDLGSACISFLSPHYQFWKSRPARAGKKMP